MIWLAILAALAVWRPAPSTPPAPFYFTGAAQATRTRSGRWTPARPDRAGGGRGGLTPGGAGGGGGEGGDISAGGGATAE